MKQNPAHLYREIAKKIVERVKNNIANSLRKGQTDLHFDLENDIVQALKYADKLGSSREYERMADIMKEFDSENGDTNQ